MTTQNRNNRRAKSPHLLARSSPGNAAAPQKNVLPHEHRWASRIMELQSFHGDIVTNWSQINYNNWAGIKQRLPNLLGDLESRQQKFSLILDWSADRRRYMYESWAEEEVLKLFSCSAGASLESCGVSGRAQVCVLLRRWCMGGGRRLCQDWSTKLTTWPLIEINER
jgi:hypothetical protein